MIKTRFFGLLSATLTGESRLITGRKPGFSDNHLGMLHATGASLLFIVHLLKLSLNNNRSINFLIRRLNIV
jgi:hypothetical protein